MRKAWIVVIVVIGAWLTLCGYGIYTDHARMVQEDARAVAFAKMTEGCFIVGNTPIIVTFKSANGTDPGLLQLAVANCWTEDVVEFTNDGFAGELAKVRATKEGHTQEYRPQPGEPWATWVRRYSDLRMEVLTSGKCR